MYAVKPSPVVIRHRTNKAPWEIVVKVPKKGRLFSGNSQLARLKSTEDFPMSPDFSLKLPWIWS